MKKRIFSFILALALCLSAGFTAFAEDTSIFTDENGIRYRILDETEKTVEVIHSSADQAVSNIPDSSYSGDITIPAKVTNNGVEYSVIGIDGMAFLCAKITSITLNEGLEYIDSAAFAGSSLTSIHIPASVKSLGRDSINSVFANSTTVAPAITSITFAEGSQLTYIGRAALEGCANLSDFEIPSTVTTIGPYAFDGCSSLKEIVIPDGVTEISELTFKGCTSLELVTFPSNLTEIGNMAFNGCVSLKSVILPEGLTTIGESAFEGCTSLESIILPEGLTSIEEQAFALAKKTVKQPIEIPPQIEWVNNDPKLEYINIPASVTSIGANFLAGVKSDGETIVVFQGMKMPEIDGSAFSLASGTYNKPTVYYPAGAAKAYAGEGSALVAAGLVAALSDDENAEQGYALPASGNVSVAEGNSVELGEYTLPDGASLDITSGAEGTATVSGEDGKLMVKGVSSGEVTVTVKIVKNGFTITEETYSITVTGSSAPVPTPDQKPVYRDTVTIEVGGEKTESGNKNEENPSTGAPVLMGVFIGAAAAAK